MAKSQTRPKPSEKRPQARPKSGARKNQRQSWYREFTWLPWVVAFVVLGVVVIAFRSGQTDAPAPGVAVSNPVVGGDLHSLVVDPDNPETLYIGSHQGVSVSSDGGKTWQVVEDLNRAAALVKLGDTVNLLGRIDDAERHLENALAEPGDDLETQARAALTLSWLAWSRGDSTRMKSLVLKAIAMLEREAPGPELAEAYVHAATDAQFGGRAAEALEWAERALTVAAQTGAQRESIAALTVRGGARCDLGDLGGKGDLRRAVREGTKLGFGKETAHTTG